MNRTVQAARAQGLQIVHAPSDITDFYAGTPARQRVADAPPAPPPEETERDDPPLPVEEDPVHSCDTPTGEGRPRRPRVWTRQHPAIEECAVVGVGDDTWGEVVAVAVVTKRGVGMNLAELRTWAGERLSSYRIPKKLVIVTELPRNAMGKVVKPAVRELFGGESRAESGPSRS